MNKAGGLIILSLAMSLVGCAKKQPYETLYKENTHSRSEIDTNADYLYVPMAVEQGMDAAEGRPFWVGQEKVVRFKWTEKELQVIEVNSDPRFNDNPTNTKVALTIPVTYHQFECKKDQYGQCTNQEEDASDRSFEAKGSFKPDFNALAHKEINLLPLELENLFAPCFAEQGSELIGYKLSGDGVNILVEKTYRANPGCVGVRSWDDIPGLSFKTRYSYSITKLDRLATKGYQALEYPRGDESTFGFFNTNSKETFC